MRNSKLVPIQSFSSLTSDYQISTRTIFSRCQIERLSIKKRTIANFQTMVWAMTYQRKKTISSKECTKRPKNEQKNVRRKIKRSIKSVEQRMLMWKRIKSPDLQAFRMRGRGKNSRLWIWGLFRALAGIGHSARRLSGRTGFPIRCPSHCETTRPTSWCYLMTAWQMTC